MPRKRRSLKLPATAPPTLGYFLPFVVMISERDTVDSYTALARPVLARMGVSISKQRAGLRARLLGKCWSWARSHHERLS